MSAKQTGKSKKSSPKAKKDLRSEDFQRLIKRIVERQSGKPLAAELAAEKLPSPIVLIGTQHVRARRIIDWLREQFFSSAQSEHVTYFGSELSSKKNLEPIAQSFLNQSLFASQTLLCLHDSDSIKAPIAKDLAAILNTKSDSTVVIICAEDGSKKTSLCGQLGANCSRVEISELGGQTLLRWIEKEARSLGSAGFESGGAEALVSYFGSDTTLLAREIEKLALLTEPNAKISRTLVQQLSFQNPEVTSFDLVHKIARKDVAAACAQALSLVDQGMHPMQISYFLSRCIRTLLARNATEAKDQLASEFTNYWFTKNLASSERRFSPKHAPECLTALRELDFNLKDSAFSDRMALSLAVQKLASRQ